MIKRVVRRAVRVLRKAPEVGSENHGQPGWRWCRSCQCLTFGDSSGAACAAGNHDLADGSNYLIPMGRDAAEGLQAGWLWCSGCGGLYHGSEQSTCAAGLSHATSTGESYSVPTEAADGRQAGWAWCQRCHVLFFKGSPESTCAVGGPHDGVSSTEYFLNRS